MSGATSFFDETSVMPLKGVKGNLKVKDKPSATVLFGMGNPFEGQAIFPTL